METAWISKEIRAQGKTKQQAIKNVEEAIALCLEAHAERGLAACG
ncbi:MAG TPA: hypothetical protein VGO59_16570 [Verrucomicrobiae bacterium]|jgi:predicted RNase H-like HicB family nuclease